MDIHGKKIVLTGAASGIGAALLRQLATRYRAEIMAVDRDQAAQAAVNAAITHPTSNLHAYGCDVSDGANIDTLFDHALATMGRIDLFIANAGFAYYERLNTPDWARLEKLYAVNVLHPIYAAVKMRSISTLRDYKVVITASAMGKMGLPGYAAYGGTKAALDRFAEAYRLELEQNSTLMLVYPITTRTGFFKAAGEGTPQPWPSQSADEVAEAIIKGIESEAHSVFPSPTFRVTLMLDRFLPFIVRPVIQGLEMRRYRQWLKNQANGKGQG